MRLNLVNINLFYGLLAVLLLGVSFWVKAKTVGWLFCILATFGFSAAGLFFDSYILLIAGLVAGAIILIRFRSFLAKNRTIELLFISDLDDGYLHHFMEYYRTDISKHFPGFNFNLEDEFLVALMVSKMETVGLIVAEIKNAETLKICIDYMVPKYRNSQLAKTFYQCELRCVDFMGYHCLYMEPQSTIHNQYLERIGFRLVDGKYVNRYSVK